MTKACQYDTVILRESIGSFHEGEKGAIVEIYTTPYEAYDIEMVTDEGTTKGLLEGIRPDQIERPLPVRFESIDIEPDGTRASIRFSDGSEMTVQADELYDRAL